MKLDPLFMCYIYYFLGCSSLKRCSLIRAPIFSSPSTTRLFCRHPPIPIFLQLCCRHHTAPAVWQSVKFEPEERSRRRPACCVFPFLLKFLDTSRQRQTDKRCWTENEVWKLNWREKNVKEWVVMAMSGIWWVSQKAFWELTLLFCIEVLEVDTNIRGWL